MKVIDMHCDTITKLYDEGKSIRDNNAHISLERMVKADYVMQCFAIFVYLKGNNHPYETCKKNIAHFKKEMENNKDMISQICTYKQLVENIHNNKMSALLTIEEGAVCEGSIEKLKSLYKDGARMMTLTWNFENEIGYPNYVYRENDRINKNLGLKDFGREVVSWMNENGMIVDVSHASDKLIWDVLSTSKKPIVASHSNARTICDIPRNLTDDMIKAIADNGGMTGINFCADFISEKKDTNQIPDIVRHIKHITNVGGFDVCGLGSDFDGIKTPNGMSDCSKMPLLYEALKEDGFTEEQIEKIFYKNFLRVFQANSK